MAKVMNKDYLIVKIDTERMKNGKDVAARLRRDRTGGIPWMVILSADGKELITSDGPRGNVGCPVRPEERAFFIEMLEKTSRRMGDGGISVVKTSLAAYAEKILGGGR